MRRSCNRCGKQYEAQRSTSKFCTADCRKRAGKARPVTVLAPRPDGESPLVKEHRDRLLQAGRLDTPEGAHVMFLAEQMAGGGPLSGVALLSKELAARMAEALRGTAAVAADSVDDLARRRADKAGA